MRRDTGQRKYDMAGLRALTGEQQTYRALVCIVSSGKLALDTMILEIGRNAEIQTPKTILDCIREIRFFRPIVSS
jgi:hypothetical protein